MNNTGFTFVPGRDSFPYLHKLAKERGITVSQLGKITIRRSDWKAGAPKTVSTTFLTYREAIRSFRHAVDGIFASSRFRREVVTEFRTLHSWLLSYQRDPGEKQRQAEAWLLEMADSLVGVRCANLVSLRRQVRENGLVTASLRELLVDKKWGAACCKLIYRVSPAAADETRRVLEQVPRILEKEQILGKLWTHDIWRASVLREKTIHFAQNYDGKLKLQEFGVADYEPMLFALDGLLVEFGTRPFDHRLKAARANLVAVRDALVAVRRPTKTALGKLIKAQLNLRNYQEWLNLSDSRDGVTPKQRQYFTAVA